MMSDKFSISTLQDYFYCVWDKQFPGEKKLTERKYKNYKRLMDSIDKRVNNKLDSSDNIDNDNDNKSELLSTTEIENDKPNNYAELLVLDKAESQSHNGTIIDSFVVNNNSNDSEFSEECDITTL